MRRLAWIAAIGGLLLGANAARSQSLPQRTIQYQALAEHIVSQLHLEPGEKVLSVAMPGLFSAIVPHLRYAVMRAGGVDLGVIEALETPYPADWDAKALAAGLEASTQAYVKLLEDVDAVVMLPGVFAAHPAYRAYQRVLTEKKGPRRTLHFHWTDAYGAGATDPGLTGVTIIPGQPAPAMQDIETVYQDAVLKTDYAALTAHQERFIAAMRGGPVRVTTPLGTNLTFSVGDRLVVRQDGDASARRARTSTLLVEREVEIPAGPIRVAPIENTVNGVLAYGPSRWNGRTASGVKLTFAKGKIVGVKAESGREAVQAELNAQPEALRNLREFTLGFNPHLTVPEVNPWVPYYGYGSGIVRLALGNNREVGGAVGVAGKNYNRFNDLFIDCTIILNGEVWVKDGKFVK